MTILLSCMNKTRTYNIISDIESDIRPMLSLQYEREFTKLENMVMNVVKVGLHIVCYKCTIWNAGMAEVCYYNENIYPALYPHV